jgi:hypothetical protein
MGRGRFLVIQCFYSAKSVFIAVNASLRWLSNVTCVYLVNGFLALNWSVGFGTFLQVSALASHWLEDCGNFTQTTEENDQYSANHS